ncbi:MAG: translation initiation factor IF-2, partial [Bacteroidota bacterium]
MSVQKVMRLSQVARKLNVGRDTIVEFLAENGMETDRNPNAKITPEQYALLAKEFASSLLDKEEAESLHIGVQHREKLTLEQDEEPAEKPKTEDEEILITNLSAETIDREEEEVKEVEKKEVKEEEKATPEKEEKEKAKLKGIKVVGKIDLEGSKGKKKEEEAIEEKAEKTEKPKKEEKEEKTEKVEKAETP